MYYKPETVLGTGIKMMNKVDIVPAFTVLSVQWRKLETKQEIIMHCDKYYDKGNTECHGLGSGKTS